MIQTLKNIILLSLCASFCAAVSQDNTTNLQNNETESKNSNLQIPANSDKITTLSQNANLQNDKKIAKNAEFESIKTLEFPKDEAEEKQLNELFMAIESLDSDKIQKLVKQNPRLVNLQCKNSQDIYSTVFFNKNLQNNNRVAPLFNAVYIYGNADSEKKRTIALKNVKILLDNGADTNKNLVLKNINEHILHLYIILDIPLDRKFEIIDFLVKYGNFNLNYMFDKIQEVEIYETTQLLWRFIPTKERLELFKFLVKHKVKINNALQFVVIEEMGKRAYKLIQNKNFDELKIYIKSIDYQKNLREMAKEYIYEILQNYTNEYFKIIELVIVGEYFIYTNDIEFINLMIDNGYLKNQELYDFMLKTAEKLQNKEIINLIKGAKR